MNTKVNEEVEFFDFAKEFIHELSWKAVFASLSKEENHEEILMKRFDHYRNVWAFNLQEIYSIHHYIDVVMNGEKGFYLQFAYFMPNEEEESRERMEKIICQMYQETHKDLFKTIQEFNQIHQTDFSWEYVQYVDEDGPIFNYHDVRILFDQTTNPKTVAQLLTEMYPFVHINHSLPNLIKFGY